VTCAAAGDVSAGKWRPDGVHNSFSRAGHDVSNAPVPAGKLSPSITMASARSVLATCQIVNNTANARRDSRLEASVETVPQITIDSVTEFVAIIPPAGKGRITIVAGSTGNVAATAS
jgi:hypothetical protein